MVNTRSGSALSSTSMSGVRSGPCIIGLLAMAGENRLILPAWSRENGSGRPLTSISPAPMANMRLLSGGTDPMVATLRICAGRVTSAAPYP